MWMMMICCALPLLLIVMFGLGGKTFGAPAWIMVGSIALILLIHLVLMSRSPHQSDKEQKKNHDKSDKEHTSHGC